MLADSGDTDIKIATLNVCMESPINFNFATSEISENEIPRDASKSPGSHLSVDSFRTAC